ncbi:hypothetical protein DPEC_G00069160 [Dallia pectoralis]|uniref:Uncharacterized protein n=1 Tax=Dallia pectoralis TaxID=75939 RepID=A0ACC2H1V2_DALPE|nr:hypothetical protein DPEC_G00069160 [Dallia pectoralis]
MNHCHIELIGDPQWVTYCVENECSFRDHIQGYVCRTHCTRHVCSGSSCALIRTMAARTRYRTDSSEDSCPVAALLVFHKQQLEFRGAYYNPSGGDPLEMGLGAIEHHPGPRVRCQETDNDHLILKATLPVTIALFSTVLTEEFGGQYDVVERGQGPEFVNRVLSGSNLGTSLPIVVTVTLDKYLSDASYPENQKCTSHGLNPRVLSEPLASSRVTNQTDTRPDASYPEYERCMSHGQNPPGLPVASPGVPNQTETRPGSLLHFTKRGTPAPAGKRRTSCSPGYFETHEGRQEEKMMRLQNS